MSEVAFWRQEQLKLALVVATGLRVTGASLGIGVCGLATMLGLKNLSLEVLRRQTELIGTGLPSGIQGVPEQLACAPQQARLRRRSKWVNALCEQLCGDPAGRVNFVSRLLRGRWRPDLPDLERSQVANAMSTLVDSGVIVKGGGTLPKVGEEGFEVYLNLELKDGSHHTIFPSLVGELKCYAAFRPRDRDTLMALRFRALQWCKRSSLRWFDLQQGFHGSVALGYAFPSQERSAAKLLAICDQHPTSSYF